MKLILGDEEKELEIQGKKTIEEVLKENDINPLTVVVKNNGELVTLKTEVKDSDVLEVISAVSQG